MSDLPTGPRVALVSGGTTGIGAAISEALLAAGHRVAANGMIGFTKSLALEGATRSITVNAIAPGYTDTAMESAILPDMLERILKSVPAGRLAAAAESA